MSDKAETAAKGRWMVGSPTRLDHEDGSCLLAEDAGANMSASAWIDLCALIEAAESTEPRDEPPTMLGDDIAAALRDGRVVERLWADKWTVVRGGSEEVQWWRHHMGRSPVVARIVEPARTVKVPWWEAKDRARPDSSVIDAVGSDVNGPWFAVLGQDGRSYVEPDGTIEVRA